MALWLSAALLATCLGAPAAAQELIDPIAIATVEITTPAAPPAPAVATLDGSASFNPNPGGAIGEYRWEVVTEEYQWLPIAQTSAQSPTATFEVPPLKLAAKLGWTIEFRLTVQSAGRPAATDREIVAFTINQPPVAVISVSARLPDPDEIPNYDDNRNGQTDETEERYPIDGLIDRAGEDGNADNEWDVIEGVLLTVDGSASYDPDGELQDQGHTWERLHATDMPTVTASLPGDTEGARAVSTDEDPGVVARDGTETAAKLTRRGPGQDAAYYLYYRLTVTDSHGATGTAVVKIVFFDDLADPEVEITAPEGDSPTDVQPAGENRYVVSVAAAAAGVELVAEATADTGVDPAELTHEWSGAEVTPTSAEQTGERSTAQFKAPDGAGEGDKFEAAVVVTDPAGHSAAASITLVVADNTPPEVLVPAEVETDDGPLGGEDGILEIKAIAFDADGDQFLVGWDQVADADGGPLRPNTRPRLRLRQADTSIVSVVLPEIETGGGNLTAYVQFEAIDIWGVSTTAVVTITIQDGETKEFEADAGPDQRVQPGAFVVLDAANSHLGAESDPGDTPAYQWQYAGIVADPPTHRRPPITEAEQGQGFSTGEWFPDTDGSYHPSAGGRLAITSRQFTYFTAPELSGFNSVKLRFTLTFSAGQERDADTVTVTVVGSYYSGNIAGPDHCADLSLGGPATFAVDGDGDGIADTCSLDTTRRAAIARQNALELLATLFPDQFEEALHGPPDGPSAPSSESSDQSISEGSCALAPTNLGDEESALDADVCGIAAREEEPERLLSRRPPAVEPAKARQFFSGSITGPSFCANYSLGGPITYPYDSDGDGVADVCSLPYTRREAAARQAALNQAFLSHPQFHAALEAECRALGTLDFGDHPVDLAQDLCDPDARAPRGQPLPTP